MRVLQLRRTITIFGITLCAFVLLLLSLRKDTQVQVEISRPKESPSNDVKTTSGTLMKPKQSEERADAALIMLVRLV